MGSCLDNLVHDIATPAALVSKTSEQRLLRLARVVLATLQSCQFELQHNTLMTTRQVNDAKVLRAMCAAALVDEADGTLSIADVGAIQDALEAAGLPPPAGGWKYFHGRRKAA